MAVLMAIRGPRPGSAASLTDCSLVDAYEVLTAIRVYYNLNASNEVIRILVKKREIDFDATLVKAFINMIGIFPIGTLLKLSSGEIGLVVHQTSDLMRPRILLLTKFDGSEKESGEEVSLLEMTGNISGILSAPSILILRILT